MSVNLGTAYAEMVLDTKKFQQGLKNAKEDLNGFNKDMDSVASTMKSAGKSIEGAGKKLTKTVTLPILGIGVAAVKTTSDFDASMSRVQALSGATAEEFDRLRNKAIEMGGKTAFSATESADALSYMALAGWDANKSIDALPGVLDLAASSQMDLAQASDLVTDFLTAFGLEAKDATNMANQLAYAQSHSNTTTQQLGDAFGNCAAQMHTAGQTMETTTAFLEAMANQGLKGSEAGTALSAVVRDITQKMENGAIAIGDTSVAVMDANGNFRSLIDIMADVEKATEGMGSAEKSAALMQTFTARSIKAVSMSLTEGSDAIAGYEQALHNVDGAAGDMSQTMLNNLNGQLTILKSTVETLLIQLGDIMMPMITKFVGKLQNIVQWLTTLDDHQKEQIMRWMSLVAAIGPALLIFGKVTKSIGGIISTVSKLSGLLSSTGALSSVGTALAPILSAAGPILAVVAAVAALGIALKKLYDQGGEFKSSVDSFVSTLRNDVVGVIEYLKSIFSPLIDGFKAGIEVIKTTLSSFAGDIDGPMSNVVDTIQRIHDALMPITEFILNLLRPALTMLSADLQMMLSVVMGVINGILNALGPMIDTIVSFINVVIDSINVLVEFFKGIITGDFSNFTAAVAQLWEDLKQLVFNFVETIQEFFTGFLQAFGESAGEFFSNALYNLGVWIGQMIGNVINFFTNLKTEVPKKAGEVWKALKEFVKDFPKNFMEWLKNFPQKVKDAIPKMKQAGKDLMQGLWDGLKEIWNKIASWFQGVADAVSNFVNGIKAGMAQAQMASAGAKSSNAGGLAYVPYNGFIAQLHEGERVLTRNENEALNSGDLGAGRSFTFIYNSPKAIDPDEANRKFKESVREVEEGFV